MNRLRAQLPVLQAALHQGLAARSPIPPINPGEVAALLRAIERKLTFAEMHLAVLNGIDWDRVDGLGRRIAGNVEPAPMVVDVRDSSLVLRHPEAVIDHVYLAFDGLVAAVVNMTDTLGRLINLCYGLEIPERQASLLAVRDRCTSTSSLGTALYNSLYTDWIKKVRALRARCQHAAIEGVLVAEVAPYAKRQQPCIDQVYSWRIPAPLRTPILTYANDVVQAAGDCMGAVITAIASSPASPIT